MNLGQLIVLVLFVGLCLGAGGVGARMTSTSVKIWYPRLRKPSWNPPSWLFAPVWTLLYILMGVAAWIVWREGQFFGTAGLMFAVQLALNVAWSGIFFAMRRVDLALGEVIFLWLSILATTVCFWSINQTAGLLFVPYLAWVSYASCLNAALYRLNRRVVG